MNNVDYILTRYYFKSIMLTITKKHIKLEVLRYIMIKQ